MAMTHIPMTHIHNDEIQILTYLNWTQRLKRVEVSTLIHSNILQIVFQSRRTLLIMVLLWVGSSAHWNNWTDGRTCVRTNVRTASANIVITTGSVWVGDFRSDSWINWNQTPLKTSYYPMIKWKSMLPFAVYYNYIYFKLTSTSCTDFWLFETSKVLQSTTS